MEYNSFFFYFFDKEGSIIVEDWGRKIKTI